MLLSFIYEYMYVHDYSAYVFICLVVFAFKNLFFGNFGIIKDNGSLLLPMLLLLLLLPLIIIIIIIIIKNVNNLILEIKKLETTKCQDPTDSYICGRNDVKNLIKEPWNSNEDIKYYTKKATLLQTGHIEMRKCLSC